MKGKNIIRGKVYFISVDWCKRHDLEECEAFLDCPFYKVDWSNCDDCKFHTKKKIREIFW